MKAAARSSLLLVLAFLALFFVGPMAFAVRAAFASEQAWQWLADDYACHRILGALAQGMLSLALTMTLAVPLAWLHHRWSIPGSRALLAMHAAAFVLPVFVIVGGLRETLGPGGWLDATLGIDVLTTVGPWGSVALANATYNAGLAALLLHAAFERRPRNLEDAAATLGASRWATWHRISWPALRPAMLGTSLLVLLFCLGSFGVVLLLGQGRIDTLDTLLYAQLRGAFPREDRAAALALVQIALQATLLGLVVLTERRAARFPGAPVPRRRRHAGATLTAWTMAAASTVPLLAVLAGGFRLRGEWSLAPWRALLGGPGHIAGFDLRHALALSLVYAAAAVVCALALTLLLAWARRSRMAPVVEGLAFLPLGTSSVVLGFAFLLAFTGRTWLPLMGQPVGIVAIHTLIAFPFVARTVLPALRALNPLVGAAGATLGASPWHRLRRIHLPLVRGPLAVACAFAAALSLGDYGASLLLMTDDTMSIAVWIGRHGPMAFDPIARAQSTALAGVLLVLTLACAATAALLRPQPRAA